MCVHVCVCAYICKDTVVFKSDCIIIVGIMSMIWHLAKSITHTILTSGTIIAMWTLNLLMRM